MTAVAGVAPHIPCRILHTYRRRSGDHTWWSVRLGCSVQLYCTMAPPGGIDLRCVLQAFLISSHIPGIGVGFASNYAWVACKGTRMSCDMTGTGHPKIYFAVVRDVIAPSFLG